MYCIYLNRDVYETVIAKPINSFIEGFNATLFAYGMTGSGKTYTVFGCDPDMQTTAETECKLGLVPRCFIEIFERVSESSHVKKFSIEISCTEVYNVKYIHIRTYIHTFYVTTDHFARFAKSRKQ